MTDITPRDFDRHLVLERHRVGGVAIATIACDGEPVPYDRVKHTIAAALTTCPACLAVQAARVVVIDAILELE